MTNTKLETRVSATHPLFPPRLESPKISLEINRLYESSDGLRSLLTENFQLKVKSTERVGTEYFGKTQLKIVFEPQYFLKQVRLVVKTKIQDKDLKVGTIASLFNMSTRTFQRHLDKNNMSFRSVIFYVRKQLAEEYIRQDNYSCQGTAKKLGFSEAATFIRSFRRWFDCTPGEYRKNFVKTTIPALNNK
ncbi:MAG: helix-turn-helix transcriptional regulator [Bermanella sp.]